VKHFNQVLSEARRIIRQDGDVSLTAVGFDARGRGFKIWMRVEDDKDKERFGMAMAGNLMVHNAIEYYVFFTGWMVLLDREETELKTRPSKDPRRREVLIVYGESHAEKEAKVFEVVRDAGERLLALQGRADLDEMVAHNSQMRFAGLLGEPHRKHAPEARERMRTMLKPMPEIFHIYGPEPLINPTLN
jgi:hypothetical protein